MNPSRKKFVISPGTGHKQNKVPSTRTIEYSFLLPFKVGIRLLAFVTFETQLPQVEHAFLKWRANASEPPGTTLATVII
jgi:hypothetical protein